MRVRLLPTQAGGDSRRPLAALTAGLSERRAGNARTKAPHLGALRSARCFLAVGSARVFGGNSSPSHRPVAALSQ